MDLEINSFVGHNYSSVGLYMQLVNCNGTAQLQGNVRTYLRRVLYTVISHLAKKGMAVM